MKITPRNIFQIIPTYCLFVSLLFTLSGCTNPTAPTNNNQTFVNFGVKAVYSTYRTTMILKTDGTLWGTGDAENGKLGDGSTSDKYTPVFIMTNVSAVSCGEQHALILKTDGSLWGTGLNTSGQLGSNGSGTQLLPVQIWSSGVVQIATGTAHSLFVLADGNMYAFGTNHYGQLMDGSTNTSYVPKFVADHVIKASAGHGHTVILKSDHTIWASGYNNRGQLGIGSATGETTHPNAYQWKKGIYPILAKDIQAGFYSTFYIAEDNSLWACGNNDRSQLGNNQGNPTLIPSLVMYNVVQVCPNLNHTLVLKKDSSLWGMGQNDHAELGVIPQSISVKITSGVSFISAGRDHSNFIKSDGSLWGMGYNVDGELGDGTNAQRTTPVQISF